MLSTIKDCHPKNDRDTFQYLEGLKGVKVLVVDDNEDSCYLISFTLEIYGFQVITATNALDALNLMDEFQPDILVSDLAMPYVDGYSLIRKIRNQNFIKKDVPAIAVTAVDTGEAISLALESGFQVCLIKPVDPDNFAQVITNIYNK